MKYRPQRLSELIRDHLSVLITRHLEFPDMLVTITEVIVDSALESAKVLVSVWPSEKQDEALKTLRDNQGELRTFLGKKVLLKYLPQLIFVPDPGPADAAKVEKAFMEIEKEEKVDNP